MSDFSPHLRTSFDSIRLHHIKVLLELLGSNAPQDRGFIRRRYLDRAEHFDEALAFLVAMGYITEANGALVSNVNLIDVGSVEFCETLAQRIASTSSPWQRDFVQYLRQFRIQKGVPTYRSASVLRSAESGVRNFLIELSVVFYDRQQDHYEIVERCRPLFCRVCVAYDVSPSRVQALEDSNRAIGTKAELAVMDYEKARLGTQSEGEIEHVALINAAAGFDIRSVTQTVDGTYQPRFIEVKAVSPLDFAFIWSENEIQMAETFGDWYYVYLVPVKSAGCVDIESIRIMCDPHRSILGQCQEWKIESPSIRCRLRLATPT